MIDAHITIESNAVLLLRELYQPYGIEDAFEQHALMSTKFLPVCMHDNASSTHMLDMN